MNSQVKVRLSCKLLKSEQLCKNEISTFNYFQVEFHPMYKQVELLEFCKENNILVQAYCSLGGSRGKHLLMEEPVVKEISKRINKTSAQVLLK